MKLYVLCAVSSVFVFLAGLGWQSGIFDGENGDADAAAPENPAEPAAPAPAVAEVKPAAPAKPAAPPKRLRFPQDLAPAAQARKVEGTATYTPSLEPHKLAWLKPDGTLHEWHESIPEEWRAYRVHETELVVVVGPQKKIFVDENNFQAGPPIRRYIFEVTVSVVVPKTGKVVGYKTFRNIPRPIRNSELWATTMIGRTVSWSFVYQWVSSMCRMGFPEEIDSTPLVREADL